MVPAFFIAVRPTFAAKIQFAYEKVAGTSLFGVCFAGGGRFSLYRC